MTKSDGNNDQLSIRKQIAKIRSALADFRAASTGKHEASESTRERYKSALKAYRATRQVPTTANRFYLLRSAIRDAGIRALDSTLQSDLALPANTVKVSLKWISTLEGWYSPSDYAAILRLMDREERDEEQNVYAKLLDEQDRAGAKRSTSPDDNIPPLLRGKVGFENGHIKWPNNGSAQPNSRKHAISKLPPGWQNEVLAKAFSERAKTKYAHAILVQHYTGCRPEELRKGVSVEPRENGEYMLTITTAKTRKIEPVTRTYMVKDERFAGIEKIQIENCKAYRSALSRMGKRLFGPDASLVPYDYRHQAGADLKQAGASGREVAEFLGHATDSTAQHYGRASSGGSRDPREQAKVMSGREVKIVRGNSLESLKGKARAVSRSITRRK